MMLTIRPGIAEDDGLVEGQPRCEAQQGCDLGLHERLPRQVLCHTARGSKLMAVQATVR